MRVLMSGGGTAGHVYPALTVAARLAEEHDEVVFVGTPDGLEARIVPEAGVRFRPLAAAGYDRARPLSLITSSVRIAHSALLAWRWMGTDRPDVVVGFGGYVSIPVGLAAVARRIPLVVLEQNSVPGLANRTLSRWARAVGVTYAESIRYMVHPERAVVVGNPVRSEVLSADRASGRRALGLSDDALVLLVFGGSRGARHINQAVVALRNELLGIEGLVVVHVAGEAEAATVRDALGDVPAERWVVLDYCTDMGGALAACDLVLARAGATSIAEITALGVPAVLVPYPYATDDHQTKNAATMVEHGAAILVADEDLERRLENVLAGLLSHADERATMAAASRALGRPGATRAVVSLCRKAVIGTAADGESSDVV